MMDAKTAPVFLRKFHNGIHGKEFMEIASLIESLSANAAMGVAAVKFLKENCGLLRQCGLFDVQYCNMKCKHKEFCRLRAGSGK